MSKVNYLSYKPFFSGNSISGTTYSIDSTNNIQNLALHTLTNQKEIKTVMQIREKLVMESKMTGLITLKQTHSDIIHFLNENNVDNYIQNPLIEGDAIITNISHVLVGILTADCVPLLYYEPNKKVIAACHAGWKGIKQNIHLQVLEQIMEVYDCHREDIFISIGPHIGVNRYEVSSDFTNHFAKKYFIYKNEKPFFNMSEKIKSDLIYFGVKSENISESSMPIKNNFFSYRNGDKYHRNLSFIGLTGNNT